MTWCLQHGTRIAKPKRLITATLLDRSCAARRRLRLRLLETSDEFTSNRFCLEKPPIYMVKPRNLKVTLRLFWRFLRRFFNELASMIMRETLMVLVFFGQMPVLDP